MKKVINSEKAPAAIGPYSQAIEANGFVFVSGQLPIDKETNEIPKTIKEQTAQSLNNIKAILEAAGLTMEDVVKTTVLMSDLNDFGLMNEAYNEFFKDAYPARAAYQVVALPKGAMVEIEAIASR